MVVPPMAMQRVTPMALSCSTQRPPSATSLASPFCVAALAASILLPTSARLLTRFGLALALARKPVRSAPSVPPTAWTPKVSSASSYPAADFSFQQARYGIRPAAKPIMTAPVVVTKPQAGVMTTRPATAPEQKPRMLGLPRNMYSAMAQVKEATAVASVVVVNAFAAMTSAATALPALKPYQPTHNMPVPTMQRTMLCGGIGSLPNPSRLPRMRQRISADHPDDICTTVPPAKSMARIFAAGFHTPFIMPSEPQTMWASGK